MITWSRRQQYEAVHSAGGCVVQAHPFRARSYNHTIYLSPYLCDAVEIYNSGNEPKWNVLTGKYAEKMGLPVTAGSDQHGSTKDLAGVVFDKPWRSIADYVKAIRERKKFGLHIPGYKNKLGEDITLDLPCKWVDGDGVVRPVTRSLW